MSKAQGYVVVVLLAAMTLGFGVGSFVTDSVNVDGAAHTQALPQPWEYQAVFVDRNVSTELNLLGQEGWELVNARWARAEADDWGYECILRRPR